jgi:hypothetical protein
MNQYLGCSRLFFLFMLALLFSCGGGGDSGGGGGGGFEACDSDYMVGPAGAVLTIDRIDSPSYGVTVEVAAGELDQCRTFYLADDNLNVSVTPYLTSGFLSGLRRREGVFEIKTSGGAPYEAEITMTLPLSDIDLDVGIGEVICAFYWDKTTDDWHFVMPQSINEVAKTMTVVTTYREVWNWGRVDVQSMDRARLEAAMKDEIGQSALAEFIADIEGLGNDIKEQNISVTNCSDLRWLQSQLLENLRQSASTRLTAAWPYIDPYCGSCDPLSSRFGQELQQFIENKMSIWMMGLLADHADNIVVEFALRVRVLILALEIRSFACNYRCVHDELGIGFWMDLGQYELAGALQYMIDWYIAVNPAMNCPII